MPDPYRFYSTGTPLPKDSETLNAFARAARYVRDRELNRDFESNNPVRQGDIIRVKNQSGRALPQFAVLGLDQPIFLPSQSLDAFKREVTFRGTIPDNDHRGKFCVLLDPVDVGRIGRAYVSGVVQCQVDVKDVSHTCCDVVDQVTANLVTSSQGGSAQMLWFEGQETGTTGVQWAYVRLGTNCRICCHSSSSSSSSTSDGCPTHACKECDPVESSCTFSCSIGGMNGPGLDPPFCGNQDGTYFLVHEPDSCTWFASHGRNDTQGGFNTDSSCTLQWDGSIWTIELTDGVHTTIWTSSVFNCHISPITWDFVSSSGGPGDFGCNSGGEPSCVTT